jgi:[histone H3]-lysine36 N-dimethyltransferase SETMAR
LRNGVQYLYDNAHPHTAETVIEWSEELGWFIVSHAPYSDEASSDFHLFRSLVHFLRGKIFNNEEEIRQALDEYFALINVDFYCRGFEKLPKIWEKIIMESTRVC